MRVRWSPEAADDLARIGCHIQRDNLRAARETVVAIFDAVNGLSNFPNRGRAGRLEGTPGIAGYVASIRCGVSDQGRVGRSRADLSRRTKLAVNGALHNF
jgi:plasmid stabilization system protein ParE